MDLLQIMMNRRSVRKYNDTMVSDEQLEKVLQAGLLSASGRGKQPWEFIAVTDKEILEKLSHCRNGSAKMLEGAGAAIVVVGNPEYADTWIEDCSIVMTNMHLMADHIGLGSCWIQGRMRDSELGNSTDEYVRNILNYPPQFSLEAILSIGCIDEHPQAKTLEDLPYNKVHYNKF